jgi:hypothetical protein
MIAVVDSGVREDLQNAVRTKCLRYCSDIFRVISLPGSLSVSISFIHNAPKLHFRQRLPASLTSPPGENEGTHCRPTHDVRSVRWSSAGLPNRHTVGPDARRLADILRVERAERARGGRELQCSRERRLVVCPG